MKLQVTRDANGVSFVTCEGTISQEKLGRDADPMVALSGPSIFAKKILLNLERTESIDSSGISWLLVCHKHSVEGGGRLILHSVPPMVMKVLHLVQLPKIISTVADEAEALKLARG